jgi:DNA-binding NtrC family response regulator
VLTEMVMGKISGLQLLAEVKKRSPFTEVALMSACGTIESAVEAMRLGAYDFVVKPFRVDKLKLMLSRMVDKVRLVRENESLRACLQSKVQCESASPLPCTDLEELERLTVQRVFERVGGDKEQAQKLLGISRATMYRKIKRYGIQTRQEIPTESPGAAEQVVLLSQI